MGGIVESPSPPYKLQSMVVKNLDARAQSAWVQILVLLLTSLYPWTSKVLLHASVPCLLKQSSSPCWEDSMSKFINKCLARNKHPGDVSSHVNVLPRELCSAPGSDGGGTDHYPTLPSQLLLVERLLYHGVRGPSSSLTRSTGPGLKLGAERGWPTART